MRSKEAFSKFRRFNKDFDINHFKASNPKLWEKLKKQFDIGRSIVWIQLNNGLDRLNEKTLRIYLGDFANRFIKYGPYSFPTSYNVLEPFFIFNPHNSVIQLLEEEESYGVSLHDFLDFVTEPQFDLDQIDLYDNIPEKMIYHFSFSNGFEEINFSNSKGKTFIIASLSLTRQGNEVSILMQAGESYDKKEAEEYFKTHTKSSLEKSISPFKKSLGFEIENKEEPCVVHFQERDDLWLHSVAVLFDLESKSIDIRHVARDENINYSIITDDFGSAFPKEESIPNNEVKDYVISLLEQLSSYDAVFDFAKYCLALPYYVFENEERLVDVTYETSLKTILKGPVSKQKFSPVPNKYKIYAKPFYYLESKSQVIIENLELNDKSFKIEKSGYWKRIAIDEEGFDKKGRKIIGKTWVERNDIYYSNPKGITKATEVDVFNTANAGYIYVMRQPTLEENIFKIGLTKRTPEERKKELSNTSSPDSFYIITSYYTKDCIEAEKQIHKSLENHRLSTRREFFKCDLRIILETCDNIVKKVNE